MKINTGAWCDDCGVEWTISRSAQLVYVCNSKSRSSNFCWRSSMIAFSWATCAGYWLSVIWNHIKTYTIHCGSKTTVPPLYFYNNFDKNRLKPILICCWIQKWIAQEAGIKTVILSNLLPHYVAQSEYSDLQQSYSKQTGAKSCSYSKCQLCLLEI